MAASEASFARATRACGEQHVRLSLAGGSVDFRSAGERLSGRLLPVLSHASAPGPGPADLTVSAWESAGSGVSMPQAPWGVDDYGVRGELAAPPGGGLFALFQVDAGVLSLFDAARGTAIYWVRDCSALPYHELAAPLRAILHWWVASRGGQFLHGAAVGGPEGAVLLAGRGGSGKSNTALACLSAGLGYLGDDYCAAFPGRPPAVHCLYASGKLSGTDLEHFPALARHVVNPERGERDKAIIVLGGTLRDRVVRSAPLRAVLLPRVGPGAARVLPVSPAAALRALAPSTLVQLPHSSEASLRTMARLLDGIPCFALELGNRRQDVVLVIRELLAAF